MFRFNIKTVSSCLTAAIHVHTKYYEIWRVKHIFEYRANEKMLAMLFSYQSSMMYHILEIPEFIYSYDFYF